MTAPNVVLTPVGLDALAAAALAEQNARVAERDAERSAAEQTLLAQKAQNAAAMSAHVKAVLGIDVPAASIRGHGAGKDQPPDARWGLADVVVDGVWLGYDLPPAGAERPGQDPRTIYWLNRCISVACLKPNVPITRRVTTMADLGLAIQRNAVRHAGCP